MGTMELAIPNTLPPITRYDHIPAPHNNVDKKFQPPPSLDCCPGCVHTRTPRE